MARHVLLWPNSAASLFWLVCSAVRPSPSRTVRSRRADCEQWRDQRTRGMQIVRRQSSGRYSGRSMEYRSTPPFLCTKIYYPKKKQ